MLPRDRGIIIQVGSALAYRGIPLQSAYCAAKHAIQGFCDSLRCELIHDGSNVRLTMVQMPAMNTPQFGWVKSRLPRKGQPVPPIFQPEVAARAIVWAAFHDRREIDVGWPTVKAIVGNKVAVHRCSTVALLRPSREHGHHWTTIGVSGYGPWLVSTLRSLIRCSRRGCRRHRRTHFRTSRS